MSLYKQLWLAVIFLLAMLFVASVVVTSLSTRAYLEQQLSMKNADNAGALAISLTQQGADPVLVELTLSAQFDTGFYELIRLEDPNGNVVIERRDEQPFDDAPGWFMRLLPIDVDPGIAQLQQGWQQAGTLTLRSHSRFAYGELWSSSKKMAGVFLLAAIVAGGIGTWLLRLILRPLDAVVAQADAIGERRFITTPEPRTQEFRQLVGAMNRLSGRVREMLEREAQQLETMQHETTRDPVSGLLTRDAFMARLRELLQREDESASGSLTLLRIGDLAGLNQRFGRGTIDSALADMGSVLNRIGEPSRDWIVGRLNGSDFAVLAPGGEEPTECARQVQEAVREVLSHYDLADGTELPAATTTFAFEDTPSNLMTRLDGALQAADSAGVSGIEVAGSDSGSSLPVREELANWQEIFQRSFAADDFSLVSFPVVGAHGETLHMEALVRLQLRDQQINAGRFLPWINRLELAGELDRRVLEMALARAAQSADPICVNLSPASLKDPQFASWLAETAAAHPEAAKRLWIEVAEAVAYRYLDDFKRLCNIGHGAGIRMGMEHMGHQLSSIGRLHDVGLDYVKIDAVFVRDIHENAANQSLLRTLCTLVHAIGLTAIAEGVQSMEEWEALKQLGVDGATGPGIQVSETD